MRRCMNNISLKLEKLIIGLAFTLPLFNIDISPTLANQVKVVSHNNEINILSQNKGSENFQQNLRESLETNFQDNLETNFQDKCTIDDNRPQIRRPRPRGPGG